MKQREFIKIYFLVIILIYSIIVVILSTKAYMSWKSDNESVKKFEEELESIPKEEVPPQEEVKEEIPVEFLSVEFSELLEINSDTVAWIQINDTNIDYPVVQSKDNDYYMEKDFYKNSSKAGVIFSDYRNNFRGLNKNTIIYGHSRLDNSMFGSLRFMLNQEFFNKKENHYIRISTPYDNMLWEIFSVYKIPKENYFITTHFKDDEFLQFLDVITKRSMYEFENVANKDDKILTLSTCGDSDGLTRIVVHAKLIEKESRLTS